MLVGDVYLNGERIGGTEYGYVGFGIDITDKIKYGSENVLVVKADTRKENNSRWYTGGGLFRTVKLIMTDKQLYFARHPLYITTKDNNTVNIQAEIFRYNKLHTLSTNSQQSKRKVERETASVCWILYL
jgi:beta-galactosidase